MVVSFFFLFSNVGTYIKSALFKVYVNAMLAQYVFLLLKKIPLSSKFAYFQSRCGRLNARTRFRAMAMADESIPLNNISFGDNTTGSSQPVDRELQLVRITELFLSLLKMLNFCLQA